VFSYRFSPFLGDSSWETLLPQGSNFVARRLKFRVKTFIFPLCAVGTMVASSDITASFLITILAELYFSDCSSSATQ